MGEGLSIRFLIDEDVPRSTSRYLREAGYDAIDVREVGLKGKSDQDVFAFAQLEKRLIINRNWPGEVTQELKCREICSERGWV